MKQKVAFHTLGCKLNYSETSSIARTLNSNGFETVSFEEGADIYVINTCSVTENADKECRYLIRKVKRISPDSKIIVTGCYAQLKPKEISEIPGVDLVLGANEKFQIVDYIYQLQTTNHQPPTFYACGIEEAHDFHSSFSIGDRTRSFLKVQDGCDYTCSYCTIPLARGKSRNDTIENVVEQAKEIAKQGVKEIVLTGVNVGDFKPTPNPSQREGKNSFLQLVETLDSLPFRESQRGASLRFRISSIEPNLLSDEIIEFVAQSKKFMPHFHIPLQSGSDKILKLMKRRYLRELYLQRVAKIKSMMPYCCIGADVIVGFPSETDEDFLETYDFIRQLDVSYLHVFTYSERDNTDALQIKEAVPVAERKKRNLMLTNLSHKKQRYFYEQHIGQSRNVLFETENDNGMLNGWTDNYIKVKTKYEPSLVRQIAEVKLDAIDSDGNIIVSELEKNFVL